MSTGKCTRPPDVCGAMMDLSLMKKLSIPMENYGILSVLCKLYFELDNDSAEDNFLKFCRCAQCFRPFPDGIFYEFEGRKYCEHDFQMLFAPCCGRCGKCPVIQS